MRCSKTLLFLIPVFGPISGIYRWRVGDCRRLVEYERAGTRRQSVHRRVVRTRITDRVVFRDSHRTIRFLPKNNTPFLRTRKRHNNNNIPFSYFVARIFVCRQRQRQRKRYKSNNFHYYYYYWSVQMRNTFIKFSNIPVSNQQFIDNTLYYNVLFAKHHVININD